MSHKFNVDIVYTWVDGGDENWIKKKEETLNQYPSNKKTAEVSGKGRFVNNDELKYSLRSIGKYAPWVNNIFIITDDQIPSWLDTNNSKIHIIDHKDIFKNDAELPCFNSNAIEMCLHNIKELAENFIFLNDDCFLGRNSSISDFFLDNGNPKLFVGKAKRKNKKIIDEKYMIKKNPHRYAILNARKEVYKKYGVIINYNNQHGIKVFNKNNLIQLEKEFENVFNKARSNQFRSNTDIWIAALDLFYSIATKKNKPFYLGPYRGDRFEYRFKFIKKYRDYVFIPLNGTYKNIHNKFLAIEKFNPLMFCINDGPNVADNKRKLMKDFLKKYLMRNQYLKNN